MVVERQQHKILIEYSLISDVHKRYFDNHQKRSLSVPSTGVLSDLENQFHRVITQLFLMMYKNGGTPYQLGPCLVLKHPNRSNILSYRYKLVVVNSLICMVCVIYIVSHNTMMYRMYSSPTCLHIHMDICTIYHIVSLYRS